MTQRKKCGKLRPSMVLLRSLFLMSGLLVALPAHASITRFRGRSRPPALGRVALPNAYCRSAFVSEFEVEDGIGKVPVNADYCELSESEIPPEAIATLGRIGEVHTRYAAAIGRPPESLFGTGVHVRLAPHPMGPIASFTKDAVEIDVFPDYRSELFPERIYAHELTHWLLVGGELGEAARDVEPNYIFNESFPDLVSSYVSASLRVDYNDPSIRAALNFGRDGTPVHSMNRPFRDFYLGSFQAAPLVACAQIPPDSLSPNERAMCDYVRLDEEKNHPSALIFDSAKERAPTRAELTAPFRAERCLIHYRDGTAGENACTKFALGPVLISFIHSIESALGDRPLVPVLDAIASAGATPDHYSCHFTGKTAKKKQTAPVTVAFASFIRVLAALREGLPNSGRATFDQAWTIHGLDAWTKLERYDRETVVATFAYDVLTQENGAFTREYGCDAASPGKRSPKCVAQCTYEPAVTSPSSIR